MSARRVSHDVDEPVQQQEEVKRWTRFYPPLLVPVVVVVAAGLILPSALNVPQSDPATVVEYAPVPPADDTPPSTRGNLSSLALGSSETIAAPPAPPPAAPPSEGRGDRPNQKRCVGSPPRQTEDLQSPPCVPYFEGDNFGATYLGVTRDEITVLAYFSAGAYEQEVSPAPGTYIDVNAPKLPACQKTSAATGYTDPKTCDHMAVRITRAFSKSFNTRYQTYGRRVHYWVYFSGANTAAGRRGDAVANYEKLRPFAVIDAALIGGFNQEYQVAMARLKVLVFSSASGSLPASFYRSVAPLGWGFYPDIEHWAAMYGSYVCQKVVPFPVRRYGNPSGIGEPNGSERRFGVWYTNDPGHPEYTLFARLVKQHIAECGANVVEESTFAYSGYSINGRDRGAEASQAAARFRSKNVTTVLYVGGEETRFSAAADSIRYYPEIVVAGDLHVDGYISATLQNQQVWQNAWATTFGVRVGRPEDSPAYRAFKEGDPNGDGPAANYAQQFYRDHFMLFQAIQVAGPRLDPESIDEGLHAIPETSSNDPFTAAFFFDPSDHTAVKDSAEQWWDPRGRAPGATTAGCYRMVRNGKRSLADEWVGGDDVFRNASDPCNRLNAGYRYIIS
jgi:hypothetical protein